MPADFSKKAMLDYIKTQLMEFETLRGRGKNEESRAQKSYDILFYILTYFNHFVTNFSDNLNFLHTIRNKCNEFINDPRAHHYEDLINTCCCLGEKMNVLITNIETENKKKCRCANCFPNVFVQHEQAGLVG